MSFTLKYFNCRGRAEIIRVLFAVGKVSFTDFTYKFDPVTYASPEFDADKATGAFTVNMDTLPMLSYVDEEGELILGQSKAIERFVAKKLGLFGSNDYESALIDMITEHVRDIKQKYNDSKAGKKDADLDAAKAKFIAEDLPSWFAKLDKTLSGTDGFAVGNKISLADVAIHHIVKDYLDDLAGAAAATTNTPRVAASAEKVAVAAADWFATRPESKF